MWSFEHSTPSFIARSIEPGSFTEKRRYCSGTASHKGATAMTSLILKSAPSQSQTDLRDATIPGFFLITKYYYYYELKKKIIVFGLCLLR